MQNNYAFIKNGNVVNVVIVEEINENLINAFKQDFDIDDVVLSNDHCVIGGTYDGSKFWKQQPYPSWVKNQETNEWESTIPYPFIEEGSNDQYIWDEETMSWLLLPPLE